MGPKRTVKDEEVQDMECWMALMEKEREEIREEKVKREEMNEGVKEKQLQGRDTRQKWRVQGRRKA